MTEQYDMFDAGNPLEKKFWEYHRENPQVYALFDRFASEAVNRNRKRFSANMIFERMRWYTVIETGGDEYKLNNNYRAYYARLWMRNHPDHDDLFETRFLPSGPESKALRL